MRRYPLSRRLLVTGDAGREARHVRHLAGAADRRRALLDRLGAGVLAVAGTRPWPPAAAWSWPAATPADVVAALRDHVGGLELVGAALPRQPGRHRVSLLCRAEAGDVVVKLGDVDDGIENEASVLGLLTAWPLPAIATPAVLASGHIDTGRGEPIAFLATDALGLRRQRPAIDERLSSFEADLAQRLATLPRPADADDDAVPVHGDLAPWNLRRTDRGLALFDWEAAGWGAPGSDLAHYREASAALRAARFRARR